MGLWTPLRPTTAGSLGLFSSFWSFPCTIPSLYLPFPLSPIFSPMSYHFQLLTPFPLTFLSLSHCFHLSFCCLQYSSCLLFVFPLWVLVPSSVSYCFCFLNSFPYFWLISFPPTVSHTLSYSPFPVVPFFPFHFPLHFIAHCFSFSCQFFYLHFSWAIFSR